MIKTRKAYSIIFFFFLRIVVFSQTNLVPNFSFETYTNCPNNFGDQIQFSLGWSKYSTTVTTPDYYNSCSPSSLFGVPKSIGLYQPERRSCDAYAGVVTYDITNINYREHIGIELVQPMLIGQKYFLSFYTVLGEYWSGTNLFGKPSNNIGLRLSTMPFSDSTPVPIDNFAHLKSTTIITDSINWQLITGIIVADSNYKYVSLGSFFDDSNTSVSNYTCSYCYNRTSYYLIDDVCISTDSLLCNGGLSLLLCSYNGFSERKDNEPIDFYPNPANNNLYIKNLLINEKCKIVNIFGTIVKQGICNSNKNSIDVSDLANGLYFVMIREKKMKLLICH